MGNLQTGESKQSKGGKIKLKGKQKGKKSKLDDVQFTGVVPSAEAKVEEEHASAEISKTPQLQQKQTQQKVILETPTKNDKTEDKNLIVTDSWRKVNRLNAEDQQTKTTAVATPPSGVSSSSDSNFTDPLNTPIGFSTEINQCYYSEESVNLDVEVPNSTPEDFLHNLTLNSFKLNEYRARHEQEKCKKLSKLGVSKMSQISLETDPRDCFMTGDNVEMVSKDETDDSGFDYSDTNGGTLKKKQSVVSLGSSDYDEERTPVQARKRISESDVSNGTN